MVVNACTRVHMRWRRFKRKFSRHTAVVKRFSSLGRAFLGAPGQGRARWLLGVLLVLCLAVGGLQVLISYAARDFMTALVNRNAVAFYHNLWHILALLSWQYRSSYATATRGIGCRWHGDSG